MVDNNLLLFAGLGGAFAAVGIHLALYSRRKTRLFKRFAQSRGYRYRDRDDGSLEAQLGRVFEIEDFGCTRVFGQVRDVVSLPSGTLFRAVELLDLNPHAQTENPHHARAAVLFSCAAEWSGIFVVTSDLAVRQQHPRGGGPAADAVATLFEQAGGGAPPHPLSLTFMRGHGLAYLEPTVTGSVTEAHLAYLADLAARLSDHASESSRKDSLRRVS